MRRFCASLKVNVFGNIKWVLNVVFLRFWEARGNELTIRTETAHVYRMMKSHIYSNLLQNY